MTRHLLAMRAQVDVTDDAGRTPLHIAAELGDAAVVGELRAAGASAFAKANDDSTPLALATTGGHHDVAQLLMPGL